MTWSSSPPARSRQPSGTRRRRGRSTTSADTIWNRPYRGFLAWMVGNGRKRLTSEQVGAVIATALTADKPKTRCEAVKGRFANATLPSLLPRRVVDRLMARQLGLPPKG